MNYLGDWAQAVLQEPQLGTGHATKQAEPLLKGKTDFVIVTYADMPLLRGETFKRLVETQRLNPGPFSLLTVFADDPRGFGRIVRNADGTVNLSAPTPRTPDGKPDFSGIWITGKPLCPNPDPVTYTGAFNNLSAGAYDVQVYYFDTNGRKVIVQWGRITVPAQPALPVTAASGTAAGATRTVAVGSPVSVNGHSVIVFGTERNGTIKRTGSMLTVTPGVYTHPGVTSLQAVEKPRCCRTREVFGAKPTVTAQSSEWTIHWMRK